MKSSVSLFRVIISFSMIAVSSAFIVSCSTAPPAQSNLLLLGAPSMTGAQPFPFPRDMYHVIGPAETLWRISKTYDVDLDELMQVNQIRDPNKIKKGQQLLIPGTYGPRSVVPLFPNRQWTHIVIHHTATDYGDAFSIDVLHHKRGWPNGMGYHFLVNNGTIGKVDGQIQAGPRWIKQQDGAHAKGINDHAIGIGIVGNFSETNLSNAELDSLVYLVTTLQEYYRIPDANVIGHRDVSGANTECPGTRFPWFEFKRRLANS